MLDALWSLYCRSLPPFPGKQRVLKLARFIPYGIARSYYGPLMAFNASDSTHRACMVGAYGSFVSSAIAGQSDPFVFIDIGANQGVFTLCAVRNPNCLCALAFEPNPSTFNLLERNIEANGAASKVTAYQAAIAAPGVSSVEMHLLRNHSGAASMFGSGETVQVRAATAAELENAFRRRNGAKLVVKLDVEGAEALVLQALSGAGLLEAVDEIIVEISEKTGSTGHSRQLQDFLHEHGWRESARSGSGNHYDAVFVSARTPVAEVASPFAVAADG